MSNMQIVFSVIGLFLILAIIGHGMWTIRKNEQKQRDRAAALDRKREQANTDGFDPDGIGTVRVIRRSDLDSTANSKPDADAIRKDPAQQTEPPAAAAKAKNSAPTESAQKPMAPDPATTEPEMPPVRATRDDEVEAIPAMTAQPEQAAMDLMVEREPDEKVLTEEPDEVIVLHVMGEIEGPVLIQQMTELGFKFGDFDIFHRHVDTAGNGPVLFSLANMFNPGTFDIDHIETFHSGGVALFLALPIKSDSKQAFTMMHNAAVKLAKAIDKGQVLDEHRNLLTRQAVQHIHQRIREYERKRLIKQ